MFSIKSWATAFVLAVGGFWFIMAEDPPRLVAADPSAVFSIQDIAVPSNLQSAEGGNAV